MRHSSYYTDEESPYYQDLRDRIEMDDQEEASIPVFQKDSVPHYPEIIAVLTGKDSNAMNLISCVRQVLRRAKVPSDKVKEFSDDALSGDYDHVLQTCMQWVVVD